MNVYVNITWVFELKRRRATIVCVYLTWVIVAVAYDECLCECYIEIQNWDINNVYVNVMSNRNIELGYEKCLSECYMSFFFSFFFFWNEETW
jgi:hypothetical protein